MDKKNSSISKVYEMDDEKEPQSAIALTRQGTTFVLSENGGNQENVGNHENSDQIRQNTETDKLESKKADTPKKLPALIVSLTLGLIALLIILAIYLSSFNYSDSDDDNCNISHGSDCNDTMMVETSSHNQSGWDPKFDHYFERVLDIHYGRDGIDWYNQINSSYFYQDAHIPEKEFVTQLKTYHKVQASREVILDNIIDFEIRTKWDTVLYDLKSYYMSPDKSYERISYTFDSPYPVYDRDFYLQQLVRKDYPIKGWTMICIETLPLFEEEMPLNPGRIRGEIKILGIIVMDQYKEGEEPLCEILNTSLIDIHGAIPKWMYNLAQRSIPQDWSTQFREACAADQKRRDAAAGITYNN